MATDQTPQRVDALATAIEALALLQELDPREATAGVMLRLHLLTVIVGQLGSLCADQQRQLNEINDRVGGR